MQKVLCNFEKKQDSTYVCSKCGYKTSIENAQKVCKAGEPPSTLQRVVNFLGSASRHALAGNPVVSEITMKERLILCQSCPLFKPNENAVGGVCTHESCGCSIQDNLNYLNKIAWADQECPIGKWGKVEKGV